jgi:hypothetical protein
MRGRNNNNNNRKGPNPLSRSYESNGPDVKIRGTAHHIGEKYLQLARDAQSGGDPVMAESYLQHAEHYFRLIAAAQQAQQAQFNQNRGAEEPEVEDLEEEDDFASLPDRFASPAEQRPSVQPQPQPQAQPQQQPQPYTAPQPQYNGHQNYQDRERPRYDRQDRGNRPERNFQDRGNFSDRPPQANREGDQRGGRGRGQRDFRPDNGQRPDDQRYERHVPRGPEEASGGNALPAFITAPTRIQPDPDLSTSDDQPVTAGVLNRPEAEPEAAGYHLRPRRRRREKEELGGTEAAAVKDSFED